MWAHRQEASSLSCALCLRHAYVRQDGASPLFCAVQEGHWDVVELLIDREADVNTQVRVHMYTLLHLAVLYGFACGFVAAEQRPHATVHRGARRLQIACL